MTLQVPFEDLAAAAQRYAIKELYLEAADGIRILTGFNPATSILIAARTEKTEKEVQDALKDSKLDLHRGSWSEKPLDVDLEDSLFVAAVGYQSGSHTPGVWVDAFTEEPTHVQVLEALYTEFRQTGELPDITIEEFIKGANPNVIVTSKTQLKGYMEAKNVKPCDEPPHGA